mmetsp:Transcript_10008/g.21545  ORF Transcript_10008/g.21545 Transcript_10008/m.21545 type:complete len:88 (-) Transcript_10008:2019-2282(-)
MNIAIPFAVQINALKMELFLVVILLQEVTQLEISDSAQMALLFMSILRPVVINEIAIYLHITAWVARYRFTVWFIEIIPIKLLSRSL